MKNKIKKLLNWGQHFKEVVSCSHQNGGHETERSVPLSHNIRLDIAVVVLASPDKFSGRFEGLSDHVVDQAMLVPNAGSIEVFLVLLLVDVLLHKKEKMFKKIHPPLMAIVTGRYRCW